MKKKLISYVVAVAVAAGLSLSLTATKAKADSAAIVPGITLSAGYAGEHFHYAETIGDQDSGWLNGFYIGANYVTQNKVFGLGNLDIGLKNTYLTNTVSYDGATYDLSSGNIYSAGGNTNEAINDTELTFGFNQALADNIAVGEYGILGYRYWKRNLEGYGGYAEYYHNGYIGIGVKANVKNIALNGLNAGVNFSYKASPSWGSLNDMSNQYGRFDMGYAYNVKLEVPIEYNISQRFTVSATPYYSYWHMSGSGSQMINMDGSYGLAYEPASETNSMGLNLGVSYRF